MNPNFASLTLIVFLSLAVGQLAARERGATTSEDDDNSAGGFKSKCGNELEVSRKAGACMADLLSIIQGKYGVAKDDEELLIMCEKFLAAERCARSLGRDCLKGLYRASVSALASSTRRFRIQECRSAESRAKYVKAMVCVDKKGREMVEFYNNYTGIMQGLRDHPITAENRLLKLCCVLNQLEVDLRARLSNGCSEAAVDMIIAIFRAMVDDAKSTICVNPKCNNALAGMRTKYTPPQNLVEPVMEILFKVNLD